LERPDPGEPSEERLTVSKISSDEALHQKSQPSAYGLTHFERIPRDSDGRHPVDVAVDNRIADRVRQRWIIKLQNRIIELLGPHSRLYLGLETKINDQCRDRERCYFNVGYEYGAAATRASLRQAPKPSQQRAELLVTEFQTRLLQDRIPTNEVTAALLQCALELVESHRGSGAR
jgi:hypothetical protein